MKAEYESYTSVFVNVYAPNAGRDRVQFLADLSAVLSQCGSEEFLFLGGDFNCTENDKTDRNHLEPHAASQRAIKQLIETQSLVDVWREMNEKKRQYTWVHSAENISTMARLDCFYSVKHHLFFRNVFKTRKSGISVSETVVG